MHTLSVNGKNYSVDVEDDTPLLWVLRDIINLKGTKFGCGVGICGACTVHLNGVPVRSCIVTVADVENAAVMTIEGIGTTSVGAHLQKAWLDIDVMQCGYCQAGQIMSAAALLTRTPAPTDGEIVAAMNGNICRCGTYSRIREAIKLATSTDLSSPAMKRGA